LNPLTSLRLRTRRCRQFISLLLLGLLPLGTTRAVETEPPPEHVAQLATRVTSVEDILALKVASASPTDAGVCLLDERFVSVDEQGRRTTLYHFAYKTLADAGIKSNSEDVYSYRKHEQKPYLLLAETIQPDGTRQPVQSNAVLIQSPQRQAQYSLYDDREELKIIFPNVKPGSITHGIVVIEDQIARFPGEVSQSFIWGGSWGMEKLRFTADFPAEIASRLKIESIGLGVPKAVVDKSTPGRVTYRWSGETIRGERYEIERAPSTQIGPTIHLSSIADWNAVGQWYRGLLASRNDLNPELQRLADEWTAGRTSPAEQIAALHAQVADEVRYVGLEFGQADYQPHDCNEVWANRYGDCKDKANLLVALLRHRGIPASIALVNTSHLGLVDRRVPDYAMFTHAIVAIPQKKGFLFCDPTIAYSTPGMLGAGSSDRDVLVIGPERTEWVRTPAVPVGSVNYAFDLKLQPSGELAGWLTLTADGTYGAYERHRYTRLEPQDLRTQMSQLARGFFPAAEVVDATRVEGNRGQPISIKAYFTVPGVAASADHKLSLSFPSSSSLFPGIGDSPDRQTTYYMVRDTISVSATIALPAGYQPAKAVPDFHLDSSIAGLKARWKFGASEARAEMDLTMKRADVRREDFARFYQGMQSLQAWLAQPMLLVNGKTEPDANRNTPELDFPQMPSGEGQINLVDQRYPENGDPDQRRRALERTLQYFPQDKNTVLRASARLAILDWNAGRNEAAHARLQSLMAASVNQVTPENYAWVESLDGVILRDLKRDDEALVQLERVSRNRQLSASRRAQAGVEAAELLARTSVQGALDLLLEIAAVPDGATSRVEAGIARLYLGADRAKELEDHLRALVASRPDTCENELGEILGIARGWKEAADGPRLARLVEIIKAVRPNPGDALAAACTATSSRGILIQLQQRITNELAWAVLKPWAESADPTLSEDAYTKAIEAAGDKGESANAFRLCLLALARHGLSDTMPRRLWRAASYADWVQRQGKTPIDGAVPNLLLDLCDQLPTSDDYYIEGRLIRASRLGKGGDKPGEYAMLNELLTLPTITPGYSLHILRRLGTSMENTGEWEKALDYYRKTEPLAPDYRTAAESLLRAVFINLHLGRDDEARRLLALLENVPAETTAKMEGRLQREELLALVKSGQSGAVWSASRTWWPLWTRLMKAQGGNAESVTAVVPVIPDLEALGTEMGGAKRDKNTKEFLRTLQQLISAARWLPSLGVEVGSMFTFTAEMLPKEANEFRKLVISLLKGPHPEIIAERTGRQLQLAIHCIDGGQPLEALKVIEEFDARKLPQDATAQAMRRLRGLAALAANKDLGPTAEAIAKDLADPKVEAQRAIAARILADIYHQLGQSEDEEKLLERELAHKAVLADEETSKALRARLTRLIGERDYSREIGAWRQKLTIPWYEYASPQNLDDPRLRNLEKVLESPDQHYEPAEQVKLHLLAATDARRTLVQRQTSFRGAFALLLQLAPTYTRYQQVATSVIGNEKFPVEIRINALWLTLVNLASENRPDDYQRWRKHELCAQFNEITQKSLLLLDQIVATDRTSVASLVKTEAALTENEISRFGTFVLSDLFDYLVTLGELDAAEKFIAGIPGWTFASDVEGTSQARQLDYARRLRQARTIGRIHDRLAALTTARFPALAETLPAVYTDRRPQALRNMSNRADTRQACLYLIKTRQYPRHNLDFWGLLLRSLVNEPGVEKFGGELFAEAMAAAETDDLRSDLVGLFTSNLDADNPLVREELRRTFAKEIDPRLHPNAHLRMRLFEAKVSQRLGEMTEVESALSGVTNPSAPFFQQIMEMDFYTQKGDLPAIRRMVDRMKTDFLLSPGMVATAMSAFAQLGMTDELQVAREVARGIVRKNVAQSWAALDGSDIQIALHLAEKLGDPALLPVAWVHDLQQNLIDPFLRQVVSIYDASLRKDWAAMEKAGREMNQDSPTHYHFYWMHGLASAKLGHREEAIKALKVYVHYSKDEAEYPEAVALLASLETP